MTVVDPQDLLDVMHEQTEREPPPIFRVAPAADDAAEPPFFGQGFDARTITRDPVSGAVAWRTYDAHEAVPTVTPTLVATLCANFDERTFAASELREWERSYVAFRIDSSLEGLPVIGPGGGAVAIRDARGHIIDALVRRRHDAMPSSWRPIRNVHDRLRSAVDVSVVEIDLELGYFELGRGDRQELLRPAFVFVVSSLEGAPWRQLLVEPATTADAARLSEGLWPWYEGEGEFDGQSDVQ